MSMFRIEFDHDQGDRLRKRRHRVHRRPAGAAPTPAGLPRALPARSPRKLLDRPWASEPDVEVVSCDLGDEAQLASTLRGASAAFYLVHSMLDAGPAYAARDRDLAASFGRAAAAAGIGRILCLGGLGETGDGLSEHLSSRREVEQELAAPGVPVTTLRAAMIIGAGSASFEILRYLVERLPIMITPRWVSTRCQPIAVEDALRYLVDALATPATSGLTIDIGGPEVLSYREILDLVADELGLRRRWILPVPVLTPRLSSLWIHLVTPLSAAIARPLAEGLRNLRGLPRQRGDSADAGPSSRRPRRGASGTRERGRARSRDALE